MSDHKINVERCSPLGAEPCQPLSVLNMISYWTGCLNSGDTLSVIMSLDRSHFSFFWNRDKIMTSKIGITWEDRRWKGWVKFRKNNLHGRGAFACERSKAPVHPAMRFSLRSLRFTARIKLAFSSKNISINNRGIFECTLVDSKSADITVQWDGNQPAYICAWRSRDLSFSVLVYNRYCHMSKDR